MDLTREPGGAAAASAPRTATTRQVRGDGGSQTVEFALVIPVVVLLALLVLHVAVAGADLVTAQALAREGARSAAIGSDAAAVVARAVAPRPVDVRADGDEYVTVRVRLRSRAFAPWGELWVPGQATMRRETW